MSDFIGYNFIEDDRNLAAVRYLDSLFAYSRFKDMSLLPRFCLILYAPLGVILIIIRLLVFLPLTGIIASCCFPRAMHTILLRVELLLFFGVWIRVNGSPSNESCIWVSNHISEFDAICLRTIGDPFIVGYSFYSQLWWLKISPLNILKMIYVDKKSRTEGQGAARDDVNAKIKEIVNNHELFLIFPEGGLTNTNVGILQYHKFVFSLGAKVQPIALRISSPMPIYVDTGPASFLDNVISFFFVPFQTYTVDFLPAIEIAPEESSLEFARRAATVTAQHLGMKLTPFLYSDKKKWLTLKGKMLKDGYDFRLSINESAGLVEVEETMKGKIARPPAKIVPIGNDAATEPPARDLLLQYMYSAWNCKNSDFSHLAFIKCGNA
jgi:ancient ubiquitous protein 1